MQAAQTSGLDADHLDAWSVAPAAGRRVVEGAHDPSNPDHFVEVAIIKACSLRRTDGGPVGVTQRAETALTSAFEWLCVGTTPDMSAVDLGAIFENAVALLSAGSGTREEAMRRIAALVRPYAVSGLHQALR